MKEAETGIACKRKLPSARNGDQQLNMNISIQYSILTEQQYLPYKDLLPNKSFLKIPISHQT